MLVAFEPRSIFQLLFYVIGFLSYFSIFKITPSVDAINKFQIRIVAIQL